MAGSRILIAWLKIGSWLLSSSISRYSRIEPVKSSEVSPARRTTGSGLSRSASATHEANAGIDSARFRSGRTTAWGGRRAHARRRATKM
jgi:hypothetical protein